MVVSVHDEHYKSMTWIWKGHEVFQFMAVDGGNEQDRGDLVFEKTGNHAIHGRNLRKQFRSARPSIWTPHLG